MAIIELISAIVGLVLIIEFFFLCRNVSEIKEVLLSKNNNLVKLREKGMDEDEENKE